MCLAVMCMEDRLSQIQSQIAQVRTNFMGDKQVSHYNLFTVWYLVINTCILTVTRSNTITMYVYVANIQLN